MLRITLKYINGNFPENLSNLLANADEQDMRVLIALMMASDSNGEVNPEISLADILGIEKSGIDASIKFWRGAGVLASSRATKEIVADAKKSSDEKYVAKSAHRNGVLEKNDGISPYATEELAALFEKRRVSAQFIDEAQRVAGRTFNSYDTGIVAGLVDQLGFEEEAVIAILSYAAKTGKKGIRYSEKLALGFYDDGVTTAADVTKRISLIEHSYETINKIKQLFGAGSRELSGTEKKLFEKWTQKFGYDIDIIRVAYDITVDATHASAPKYTDAILSKWYDEGLKTANEAIEYEKSRKAPPKNGSIAKSYELDDFFEAALQRSFEDLK